MTYLIIVISLNSAFVMKDVQQQPSIEACRKKLELLKSSSSTSEKLRVDGICIQEEIK